ncbi:MAG: RNA polymerase sigma factor [Alicyclobacillus sp.]|nr:RNA polymerase sigma factor [Alicyclobacillus sp.]
MDASEATRFLFDAYADAVYRYARYILRDSTEAEDAVQDIFIKVLRSWDQFQGRADPKTWLWTITRHHLYDRLRKRKADGLLFMQLSNAIEEMVQVSQPHDLEIEELLLGLKLSYRQVLVLRYLEGMATEEIAAALGWSHAKVRTTLHRAIKELRHRTHQSMRKQSMHWKVGEPHEA